MRQLRTLIKPIRILHLSGKTTFHKVLFQTSLANLKLKILVVVKGSTIREPEFVS